MDTATGILLMQRESMQRVIAPMQAAFDQILGRLAGDLLYAYHYDWPRVNSDAEVW